MSLEYPYNYRIFQIVKKKKIDDLKKPIRDNV